MMISDVAAEKKAQGNSSRSILARQ